MVWYVIFDDNEKKVKDQTLEYQRSENKEL